MQLLALHQAMLLDMTTIGFTSSVNREEMLAAGADHIVDDFFQLKELINNLLDNTYQ